MLPPLFWPNEANRKDALLGTPGVEPEGGPVAAFAVAASLLTLTTSEASAWVCYATGLGTRGYARAYDIIDAKLFALRRCERYSPVPVCILMWCRPGG